MGPAAEEEDENICTRGRHMVLQWTIWCTHFILGICVVPGVRTRTSRWKSQGNTFGSSQKQTSYLSQVSWFALLWRQWDPIGWRPLRGDTERLLSSIHSNPEILRFKSRNSHYVHKDPTWNQQSRCPAFRRAASRERHGARGETS